MRNAASLPLPCPAAFGRARRAGVLAIAVALAVVALCAPPAGAAVPAGLAAMLGEPWQTALTDMDVVVHSVTLEAATLDDKGYRQYAFETLKDPQAEDLQAANIAAVVKKYAWGRVSHVLRGDPQRGLVGTLEIVNTSDRTLADFDVSLLTVRFPASPEQLKGKGKMESTLDRPLILDAAYGDDAMLLICDTFDVPVHFGYGSPTDKDKAQYPVRVRGGVVTLAPGDVEPFPHGHPRIAPGKTLTFEYSLRVVPQDADREKALSDFHGRYRQAHPFLNEWKGHGPIGALHLNTGGGGKSEKNPRGWFGKKDLDVSTPEGRAELRKHFMAYAASSVKAMKDTGSQGMIVWNLEGEENPHPISYIGDPRMLKTLAPEVEPLADDFFRVFRDAGFRTGVCIRPTQTYFKDDGKLAHGTGSDMPGRNPQFTGRKPKHLPDWKYFPIVDRMSDKITYAQKRWGCTIFYIDTNGIFIPTGEDNKFQWILLPHWMWVELKQRHPDVLLIPELYRGDGTSHVDTWSTCATYMELDYGGLWITPDWVVRLWDKAFSVNNMKDAKNYDARLDDLIKGVKRGDILLHRGWFGCRVNALVKAVYDKAR